MKLNVACVHTNTHVLKMEPVIDVHWQVL